MNENLFLEIVLDNIQDAVYVLDDKGNYVFVNSAYIQMMNMSKTELLSYNVHKFLDTSQINTCVSDIVYNEKHRVVMFQDIYDTLHHGRGNLRNLIVSTPIFDENGNVKNVVAVLKRLDKINDDYNEASMNSVVTKFSTKSTEQSSLENFSIIAESARMREVIELATNIANADSTVLITGESGVGKEVIAKYIHALSDRKNKSFVVVNCASLPETLLEAELFGYEKGAFTGASTAGKPGIFECADGGTLFLDEINSIPLSLQGKLLRAIETKTIQRIGSTRSHEVDFRLLTATNEDLELLVMDRKFRADLYYRLNVIPIIIPPLRDRREDIIPLAMHFLKFYCQKNNKNKTFSSQTLENILDYEWLGNVRELKNFVERSVVMSFDNKIEIHNIGTIVYNGRGVTPARKMDNFINQEEPNESYERMLECGISLEEYLTNCEHGYVKYALEKFKTSYAAANALGTSQTSIMRRKKKFDLN